MTALREQMADMVPKVATVNMEVQTDDVEAPVIDVNNNGGGFQKKYTDAKRKLTDCVALLREYEEMQKLSERRLQQLTEAASLETSNAQRLTDEVGRQKEYSAQLEGQLSQQVQLVDMLKANIVASTSSAVADSQVPFDGESINRSINQ